MNIFQLLKNLVNRCCFWRDGSSLSLENIWARKRRFYLRHCENILNKTFSRLTTSIKLGVLLIYRLKSITLKKINAERREKERQEARHEAEKRVLLKSLREHFFEQDFLRAYDFYHLSVLITYHLRNINLKKSIMCDLGQKGFRTHPGP